MKKIKLLTALILCTMLIAKAQPAFAGLESDTPIAITPYFTYISVTNTGLAITNGKANCQALVLAKSNSSSLKIVMSLQVNKSGTWSTQKTWSDTATAGGLTLTESITVSKGTYRVKATYTVNGESTVQYSTTKTF